MPAYYNEIDPFAAQWLRNLISAGLIAPGDVDERSIEDVRPDDVRGYKQCHFFAGIGGWSYALRLAGWPDEREVWTGSCPCQPFSQAGKRKGFSDERDLWPAFEWLIQQRAPSVVLGEQVASAHEWWLRAGGRLEYLGYATASATVDASTLSAWQARQRRYFVAYRERMQQSRQEPCCGEAGRMEWQQQPISWDGPWESALSRFRALDDGVPRSVAATDAIRNAIVPQVAAEFISAYMECCPEIWEGEAKK